MMQNLTRAHFELFRRRDDERFESLAALYDHCRSKSSRAQDRWHPPTQLEARALDEYGLTLAANDEEFVMNDWSFSQLCKLAGVGKETVNRLYPSTAAQVFAETLPKGTKPLQLFTDGAMIRSIHGTSYTRLHDADLVATIREFAVDFEPPQKGFNGATGLYAGEQDLFCFLIDPAGWTEIDGEAFAPGFFIWNSEVGRRSLGIQTFWFQAVCQNHIVWDAVDVFEFTRKHTANVHESLREIRRIIEALVTKRDQRRDGFAKVIRQAMETKLGDDAEEVLKVIAKYGISRSYAKQALDIAQRQGRFTIFSVVDALTRIARETNNAGDRTDADEKASRLLSLAAVAA